MLPWFLPLPELCTGPTFMQANRMMPSTGRMPQMYQNPHHRYGARLATIPRRAQERARYIVTGIPYRIGKSDRTAGPVPLNILGILDQLAGKHGKECHDRKGHDVEKTGHTAKSPAKQEHARGKVGYRNIPEERGAFQPGCIPDEEERS